MEKIGLYFGSFNPIHNGHLMIANYCIEHYKLDKIIFIVTPQNPFKVNKELAPFQNRFEMVNVAIDKHPKMEASDIEINFPTEHYTVDVLDFILENKVFCEFKDKDVMYHMIIGLDNWIQFNKWKDYEKIIGMKDKLQIDVVPRLGYSGIEPFDTFWEITEKIAKDANVDYVTNSPLTILSSTFIRSEIKEGRSVMFYTPCELQEYLWIYNNK